MVGPQSVRVFRLEEATEAGARFFGGGHPEVMPPGCAGAVFVISSPISLLPGEEGYEKVIVGVFYRTRNGAMGNILTAARIVCVNRDVSQPVIVNYISSSLDTPIWWFNFWVLLSVLYLSRGADLLDCTEAFFPG